MNKYLSDILCDDDHTLSLGRTDMFSFNNILIRWGRLLEEDLHRITQRKEFLSIGMTEYEIWCWMEASYDALPVDIVFNDEIGRWRRT